MRVRHFALFFFPYCLKYTSLAHIPPILPSHTLILFPGVATHYGDGCSYKSVWDRMTQLKDHGNLLRDAVAHGIDPHTVELKDSQAGAAKKKTNKGQNVFIDGTLSLL